MVTWVGSEGSPYPSSVDDQNLSSPYEACHGDHRRFRKDRFVSSRIYFIMFIAVATFLSSSWVSREQFPESVSSRVSGWTLVHSLPSDCSGGGEGGQPRCLFELTRSFLRPGFRALSPYAVPGRPIQCQATLYGRSFAERKMASAPALLRFPQVPTHSHLTAALFCRVVRPRAHPTPATPKPCSYCPLTFFYSFTCPGSAATGALLQSALASSTWHLQVSQCPVS